MNKFWTLLDRSVLISGTLALSLCGAVIYLAVTGQPVPDILAALTGTAVGYYLGSGKPKDAIGIMKARATG